MLTGAPNWVSIDTKYGNNGNPDNKFMKKKYIVIKRKGLMTSGLKKCFQAFVFPL